MAETHDSPARTALRAAVSPLALAVVGASGAGAVLLHSGPIFAVGALAWSALVAWEVVGTDGPRTAAKVEPIVLPEARSFADAGCRDAVTGLLRARTELQRVLAETPPEVRAHLAIALGNIRGLEEAAVSLLSRAESLNDYLRTQDPKALRADADRLARLASDVRDDKARAEYESAHAGRLEQLRALDDIRAAKDRILANLSRIVVTLDSLPTKIVKVRALDEQAIDALGGDVSSDLEHLNQEIRVFERTLEGIAAGGA